MDQVIEHALQFHKDNNIPIAENIFRPHSENYYGLFRAARSLKENLDLTSFDRHLLSTNIGEFGTYEGEEVPLDHPFIAEAEYKGKEVELDKPKRGGEKKYFVYVKNDKGNVVKVEWGDTSGLTAKISNKTAAASFAARHRCHLKTDRTTPGWWACNMPRYAKDLGLKGGGNFFW